MNVASNRSGNRNLRAVLPAKTAEQMSKKVVFFKKELDMSAQDQNIFFLHFPPQVEKKRNNRRKILDM